jgi:uncharacterized protein
MCSTSAFVGRAERWRRLAWYALCLLSVWATAGCSTYAQRVRAAREHFYAGRLELSAETLEAHIQRHPSDADAAALELAMVQLVRGQPAESERTLRRVRDNLDHFEQRDSLESGLSLLTDDQRLAFAGSGYEQVLTRVFLSLASLVGDGQDAESYSLQINRKQEQLLIQAVDRQIDQADRAYTPLAIGPYLRGVMRESTFTSFDDAAHAYHQVVSWQPGFRAGPADLDRARHGVHSAPGHGVMYLFVLANRGPVKEERLEMPATYAMLIADRILSAVSKYDVTPTLAPIKVPRVVVPPRELDCVAVTVGGRPVGTTETICDVAELALRQEEVELPQIMARVLVRRALKKAAVYAAKESLSVSDPWSDLGLSALGVVWEATEAADTRCWGLLPREIQVLRVELPQGTHAVELEGIANYSTPRAARRVEIEIEDGRNTYVLACFPGTHAVGQVLWQCH